MRVIQVLAGADVGGAEMAYVDMCIAMKDAGIDILAVTRPNDLRISRLKDNGVTVKTLPFGGVFDFRTKSGLKKIIKDYKPDIVQGWMSRASSYIPAGNGDFLKFSRLGNYYKLKYFKDCDHFITITPDIKRYLVEEGINDDSVTFINNFADTELVVKNIDRASLDTPDDAKVILSLSRLHDAKAIDVLIKAVSKIDDVYLWMAGDGPLRKELEQLAVELGVESRVRFLGWREDRAALLNSADICCFPSRFEPFGTVFLQAWAQKTPLIVSNAKGPSQFVRDGEDGLVFNIDDIDALAKCLKEAMGNKELCDLMVDNGWNRYLNEFTKEKVVNSYINTYKVELGKA